MTTRIKISGIIEESISNGPGIRLVLFAQGCPHHCAGCHNPQTHDPTQGYFTTVEAVLSLMDENPLLDGITLSGGEPFLQAEPLAFLANQVKQRQLSVVTYSGYTYEELLLGTQLKKSWHALLSTTDILIDGRFEIAEQSGLLTFRGSKNQRIIDLNQTKMSHSPVIMAL